MVIPFDYYAVERLLNAYRTFPFTTPLLTCFKLHPTVICIAEKRKRM
jgi:hypothetical protein